MRRLTIATATALTVVAALSGCATTSGPTTADTPRGTATSTPTNTDAPATSTPTPTPSEMAIADPKAVEPTTPASTPATSALAQHIYDQCSIGAAAAGVRLTFTGNPTGYTEADGHYQLIYPFTFLDGHDDPYAVYNCALTDASVTSKYVGGGLSDAH